MTIKIKLDGGAYTPHRAHKADVGADLFSPVEAIVYPGCHATIDTGVHMEIPFGYKGVIMSKSGLLRHYGIITTGLVDSGYTGEIGVTLINTGNDPFVIKKGQKIAQIIIRKVELCEFAEVSSVDELFASERGDGGFGSTGIFWDVPASSELPSSHGESQREG